MCIADMIKQGAPGPKGFLGAPPECELYEVVWGIVQSIKSCAYPHGTTIVVGSAFGKLITEFCKVSSMHHVPVCLLACSEQGTC